MATIQFDDTQSKEWIHDAENKSIKSEVIKAFDTLSNKSGAGNEFLGWLDLPVNIDPAIILRIKEASIRIKKQSDVLVIIGIGGSYLGAKSGLHFLNHEYYNQIESVRKGWPEIYFTGHMISGEQLNDLKEVIGDRDFSVNVISKSGTTTEPAIAFRILKKKLYEKYGQAEGARRIYATTDGTKGALKKAAIDEGFETFSIPDDVGGRFSVLTAVGLLPLACAGIDIDKIIQGAARAHEESNLPYDENPCLQYVAARNLLYRNGKMIEILANYNPRIHYLAEWWKQLFGESEGKEGKGIFPVSVDFTTDLHSLGQYIQDGHRHLFVTTLHVQEANFDLMVPNDDLDLDKLNYLSGRYLSEINDLAQKGTIQAHRYGGVPNLKISLPQANAFHLGYIFYFFQKACAISGYLLGVNPFDQPGVEEYKRNMFRLLGKEGY